MKQKRLLWIQSPPEKAVPASCGHSFYSRGSLQQEFLRELAEISFCKSVGTLSPFLVLVKTVTFHCSTLFLSRLLSFFQQNGAGSFCMSSEERKSPTRKMPGRTRFHVSPPPSACPLAPLHLVGCGQRSVQLGLITPFSWTGFMAHFSLLLSLWSLKPGLGTRAGKLDRTVTFGDATE